MAWWGAGRLGQTSALLPVFSCASNACCLMHESLAFFCLQALQHEASQLAECHGAAVRDCAMLAAKLRDARQQLQATEAHAAQQAERVACLERRLARAREGGCKALGSASKLQAALADAGVAAALLLESALRCRAVAGGFTKVPVLFAAQMC